MARLKWTGPGRFVDNGRNFEAPRPDVYDVPDDVTDEYLERLGWEDPDESDGEDDSDEGEEDAESASEGEGDTNTTEETDADSDDDSAAETDGEFDAEAFVDGKWNEVADAIRDGEVDGHLAAVREAEHNRDNDPRKSVTEALDERESGTAGE